jgi:hypothetical protein
MRRALQQIEAIMQLAPAIGTRIIETYERAINDALMHIACHPPHQTTLFMVASRDMLIDQLEEISHLRFGEHSSTRPCGYYSGPLFWHIFGYGGEVVLGNVAYRMSRRKRRMNHVWIDHDVKLIADALLAFHTAFARGCEDACLDRIAISKLIDEFKATIHADDSHSGAPGTASSISSA